MHYFSVLGSVIHFYAIWPIHNL